MIIQRTFVGIVATNEFVGTKTGRRDATVAGTGLVVVAIDFRRVDDALSRGTLTDVNAVAFVVILA
jgi:galactokinase